VSQLLDGQKRGTYDPYGFVGDKASTSMPMMAEMRMQADMASAPLVSNTSDGQILENYMDETVEKPIASYAEAKTAVK
jgi:hypothetical protein